MTADSECGCYHQQSQQGLKSIAVFVLLLFLPTMAPNAHSFTGSTLSQRTRIDRPRTSAPTRSLNSNNNAEAKADAASRRRFGMARSASTRGRLSLTTSPHEQDERASFRTGVLVLTTVPVAWGTFEVAVRYVYALTDPAVPAVLFSLAYYAVATAALVPAAVLLSSGSSSFSNHEKKQINDDDEQYNRQAANDPKNGDGDDDLEHTILSQQIQNETSSTTTTITMNQTEAWPILGGLELGTYLFAGNLLQVVGLQTVASDRAAFLLQLTTIFVPLAQPLLSTSNSKISTRIWVACGVALTGVGIMGLDNNNNGGINSSGSSLLEAPSSSLGWTSRWIPQQHPQHLLTWSTGDTLIVLAAVAYTFHCLRLEGYAQQTSAVKLAACKATAETAWSALSVILVLLAFSTTSMTTTTVDNGLVSLLSQSGRDSVDFVTAVSTGLENGSLATAVWLPALLGVVWTGLVPVAYTIAAQSYGQRRVRPVTANMIYSIQPVCTALFAYLLLHEVLGVWGYVGGALIGSAVLLVVTDPSSAPEQQDTANSSMPPVD